MDSFIVVLGLGLDWIGLDWGVFKGRWSGGGNAREKNHMHARIYEQGGVDVQMRPAVVMDCGTGFSKMGYGGNKEVSGGGHDPLSNDNAGLWWCCSEQCTIWSQWVLEGTCGTDFREG